LRRLKSLAGSPLSFDEIRSFASWAGFAGDHLVTATAIALAESGGDPTAAGDPTLGHSFGLWQINSKEHPEFDPHQLLGPAYNARAAFEVYRDAGASFEPWSTFKSGAYKKFLPLPSDQTADAAPVSTGLPPDAGASLASGKGSHE
jgi:hypothetical protein